MTLGPESWDPLNNPETPTLTFNDTINTGWVLDPSGFWRLVINGRDVGTCPACQGRALLANGKGSSRSELA